MAQKTTPTLSPSSDWFCWKPWATTWKRARETRVNEERSTTRPSSLSKLLKFGKPETAYKGNLSTLTFEGSNLTSNYEKEKASHDYAKEQAAFWLGKKAYWHLGIEDRTFSELVDFVNREVAKKEYKDSVNKGAGAIGFTSSLKKKLEATQKELDMRKAQLN